MKTYTFLFQPWDGTPTDKFSQPIAAVNDAGAWEKAKDLAIEKQCTIIALLLCR